MVTEKPDYERCIVEMRFGAHLYGLDTPASDIDTKMVFMPHHEHILLEGPIIGYKESTGDPLEKNKPGDQDYEMISFGRFMQLAMEGNTMALDMIHAPREKISYVDEIWYEIYKNKHKLYTKNLSTFVDYVRSQAAKYGIKGSRLKIISEAIAILAPHESKCGQSKDTWIRLEEFYSKLPITPYSHFEWKPGPKGEDEYCYYINGKHYGPRTGIQFVLKSLRAMYDAYGHRAKLAEKNEGIDWKAVSHALRAGYQARDIYNEGGFTYPLKETEYLKKVKLGELNYKTEVAPILEALVDEVSELAINSDYPEEIDRKFWKEKMLEIYDEVYGSNRIRSKIHTVDERSSFGVRLPI